MSKKPHAIAEAHFDGPESTLSCACGWQATMDTPAGLHAQYQGHRKTLGLNMLSAADMGVSGVGTSSMRVVK